MKKISKLVCNSENNNQLLEILVVKLEEYISIEEIMVNIYKNNEYIDYNEEIEYKTEEESWSYKITPILDLNKYSEKINPLNKIKSISDLRRFIIRYQDIILENMLKKNKNFKPDLISLSWITKIDLIKNKNIIKDVFSFLLDEERELKQDVEKVYSTETNEKYNNIKENILSKVFLSLGYKEQNAIDIKLKKDWIIVWENTTIEKYKEYVNFASKLNKDILLDENFSFHFFFSLNKELECYYNNSIEIIDKLYKELNKNEFTYFQQSHFLKIFVNKFYLLNEDDENVFYLIKYFFNLEKEYAQDIFFLTEKSQINFTLNNKDLIKKILDAWLIYSIKNFFWINDKILSSVINKMWIDEFIYNINHENNVSFTDNLLLFLKRELKSWFIIKKEVYNVDDFVEKFA